MAGRNNKEACLDIPFVPIEQRLFHDAVPGAEQPPTGSLGQVDLGSGLRISMLNIETPREIRVRYHKRPATIDFGFVLSGRFHHRFRSPHHPDLKMDTGSAGIGHFPERRGRVDIAGGPPLRVLHVHIEPERLYQLIQEDMGDLPPDLRSVVEGNSAMDFLTRRKMDPAIQAVSHNVFFGRLDGLPKSLYLEAKALELIALQLRPLMSPSRKQAGPAKLSPSEIERIHAAHDELIRDLSAPPALGDLGRQYSLSLNKLQQGFHALYGDSVFGCLREYKMQTARQLFETTDLNVSRVAWKVGYLNLSHFTTAFKKRFGVLPKQYSRSFPTH